MAAIDVTSWMPNILGPVEFLINGVLQSVPKRLRLNFIGAVTVVDNPGADRTDITIAGGGGGGLTNLGDDMTLTGGKTVMSTRDGGVGDSELTIGTDDAVSGAGTFDYTYTYAEKALWWIVRAGNALGTAYASLDCNLEFPAGLFYFSGDTTFAITGSLGNPVNTAAHVGNSKGSFFLGQANTQPTANPTAIGAVLAADANGDVNVRTSGGGKSTIGNGVSLGSNGVGVDCQTLRTRDTADTVDVPLVRQGASNTRMFGEADAYASSMYGAVATLYGVTSFGVINPGGSGYSIYGDGNSIQFGRPVIGDNSTGGYGVGSLDGLSTHDFSSDADITLTVAEYTRSLQQFLDSGALLTATRVVNFPTPASDIYAYRRYVINSTGQSLTLDCTGGVGVTQSIGSGAYGTYWFTPAGVHGPF